MNNDDYNDDNTHLLARPEMDTMGDPADVITVSDSAPRAMSQQVTGFIDDAANRPSSLPSIQKPDATTMGSSLESRVHSIVDVLSRPVLLVSGDWNDSSNPGDTIFSADFPSLLFNASPNLTDKLNFFAFLRADVCIRILVNANTFQAGKLLGYFTPFDRLVGNRATVSDFTTSYTAFPHVLVDASVGNSADLCIPYVAPYSSFRLTDNTGNIGSFFLTVLNPLRNGECTFTVYAWLTNISVDVPSGKENSLSSSSGLLTALKRLIREGGYEDIKKALGVTKFVGQVAGESETKSTGVISATANKIATLSSDAATVPSLAPIAAPLTWVARAIAGVAEYFGYSKSQNVGTPSRYTNIPGYGWTNSSGVESGVVLGSSQDNAIEPRGDMFGSSYDDMDISYICKHLCYVDMFEFSTNQGPGELLYSFPVSPGWCQFNDEVYEPTTTAFVASMFNYWRGSLRYKVQAAKTAYHSGRIRIVYLPAATTPLVDDAAQAYNWVLDLRNSSEIEFIVPYNNIVEWSQCRLGSRSGVVGSIGTIRIEVLNELRGPDSVTPTIELNVWLAGGDDLQFALPTFQNYVPSFPSNPTRVTVDPRDKTPITFDTEFKGQVLGSFQDSGFNDMSSKAPLFKMTTSDMVTPCKTSIGEHIKSLRYVIRRFAVDRRFPLSNVDRYLELPSYYFSRPFNESIDDINTFRITPIDYVSWLYRFFRGGIRWKFLTNSNNIDQGYQEAVLVNDYDSLRTINDIPSTVFERFFETSSSFWHRVYTIINPVLEVTTPFFSQTPIRPIVGADTAQPKLLDDTALFYHSHITGGTSATGTLDILKAAHDDFSYGWIVGPPRLRPRQRPFITVNALPATGAILDGELVVFENAITTSDLPDATYNVLESSPSTVNIVYLDGTSDPADLSSDTITKLGTDITFRVVNPAPQKVLNVQSTLSNFQALGNIDLLVSGPL